MIHFVLPANGRQGAPAPSEVSGAVYRTPLEMRREVTLPDRPEVKGPSDSFPTSSALALHRYPSPHVPPIFCAAALSLFSANSLASPDFFFRFFGFSGDVLAAGCGYVGRFGSVSRTRAKLGFLSMAMFVLATCVVVVPRVSVPVVPGVDGPGVGESISVSMSMSKPIALLDDVCTRSCTTKGSVACCVSACSLRRRAAIRAEGYVTNVLRSGLALVNFAPQFAHSAALRFTPPARLAVDAALDPCFALAPFLPAAVDAGRLRARGRCAPPRPSRRPPQAWHHHSDMTPTEELEGMSSSRRTRAMWSAARDGEMGCRRGGRERRCERVGSSGVRGGVKGEEAGGVGVAITNRHRFVSQDQGACKMIDRQRP